MKKLAILTTILTCLLTFVACGNNEDTTKEKDNKDTTTTTTTANAENNAPDESKPQDEKKEFDAQAILDEILANHTFSDMTEFEDVMFLEVLYGINGADVKQFAMYMNETGITADEIIIIEAVDADATKRVSELVMNWYTAKGIQMKDYLPEEYKKIEKSSVKTTGNYVYMVVADDNEAIEKIIEKYI